MALSVALADQLRVNLAGKLERVPVMRIITASELLSYYIGNNSQDSYADPTMKELVCNTIYETFVDCQAPMPADMAKRMKIPISDIQFGLTRVLVGKVTSTVYIRG